MMDERFIYAILLIGITLGTVIIMLICMMISLKTLRRKIDKQSKLIKGIVETNESVSHDLKVGASLLQESAKTTGVKYSLLRTLKRSFIFTFIGIALLAGALYTNYSGLIVSGGVVFGIGVALLITFFTSNSYLRKEIETEEKQL